MLWNPHFPNAACQTSNQRNHHHRGMLVVDETLLGLIPFLEDQRFWVRPLKPGWADEVPSRATAAKSGIGYLLSGRTLVTTCGSVPPRSSRSRFLNDRYGGLHSRSLIRGGGNS